MLQLPRFFVRPDHYANPSYFYAEHLISHDSVQLGTLQRVPRLEYLRDHVETSYFTGSSGYLYPGLLSGAITQTLLETQPPDPGS